MQDYKEQLYALLGDCVNTQLHNYRYIYQYEQRIDADNPEPTLIKAARDIKEFMSRMGCSRVHPMMRATTHWLDVNCLLG